MPTKPELEQQIEHLQHELTAIRAAHAAAVDDRKRCEREREREQQKRDVERGEAEQTIVDLRAAVHSMSDEKEWLRKMVAHRLGVPPERPGPYDPVTGNWVGES